jgi:hypothetical protein
MSIPVIPVTYCGSIDLYILLGHLPRVLVEVHESYAKQTLRNRCRIYSANGPLDLVIPVRHGAGRLISSIMPDNSVAWQRQHWNALITAYRRSPFFEFYEHDLLPFYTGPSEFLTDLDMGLTRKLCELTGLACTLQPTESYGDHPATADYRQRFKISKDPQLFEQSPYLQVFNDKHGFVPNLSVLDLLFNLGPEAGSYLRMQSPRKKISVS